MIMTWWIFKYFSYLPFIRVYFRLSGDSFHKEYKCLLYFAYFTCLSRVFSKWKIVVTTFPEETGMQQSYCWGQVIPNVMFLDRCVTAGCCYYFPFMSNPQKDSGLFCSDVTHSEEPWTLYIAPDATFKQFMLDKAHKHCTLLQLGFWKNQFLLFF